MSKTINLRNTKLYKKLNSYLACAYAEGFCEGENATNRQRLIAFQYLHDKNIAYSLQGSFGRIAQELIAQRLIQA